MLLLVGGRNSLRGHRAGPHHGRGVHHGEGGQGGRKGMMWEINPPSPSHSPGPLDVLPLILLLLLLLSLEACRPGSPRLLSLPPGGGRLQDVHATGGTGVLALEPGPQAGRVEDVLAREELATRDHLLATDYADRSSFEVFW